MMYLQQNKGAETETYNNNEIMSGLSVEEIRKRFESSKEFNEIFDAFEQALAQRLDDIGLYQQLFWNNTLTPDELCLFGEKLAKEFSSLAYDAYLWLAHIFEVSYSMYDNHERALEYFGKAACARPGENTPYLEAAKCYEPDLNIPPVQSLVDFLKRGVRTSSVPKELYERLIELYDYLGNDEMIEYYRRKLNEDENPPTELPPQE